MKDLAKRAILASGAMRLISPGDSAAILMYHSVMPDPAAHADSLGGIIHSESVFREQMELLRHDYHPLSLEQVVENLKTGKPSPKRSVVVTFDDGYTDNCEVAMPILDQLGIPATFYVTVDCIEQRKLPWPSRLRWPRWTMIPYLLFADIQNTALSAFLIFSERVLYPTYATVPRLWGISVLDDQAAAGAIMWVPGSVIFLVPVALLSIRLLDASRTRSAMSKKVNYEAVKVE